MAIAAEKSAAEGRWVQFSEIPETVVCTDPLNCKIDFTGSAEAKASEEAEVAEESSEVRKPWGWQASAVRLDALILHTECGNANAHHPPRRHYLDSEIIERVLRLGQEEEGQEIRIRAGCLAAHRLKTTYSRPPSGNIRRLGEMSHEGNGSWSRSISW